MNLEVLIIEEYLREIKLTDKESFNLLFQEFPDYTNEIEEVVRGFLTVIPTIDDACKLARRAIYLSSAGD